MIDSEIADPSTHDLTMELHDTFGGQHPLGALFLIDGALEVIFYGKNHKKLGDYTLTLWLNKGKKGQSIVDACKAFSLVSCSCQEGGVSTLDLAAIDIKTASLDVGGGSGGGSGVSDYALLSNKPRINDMVLNGNKTAEELGLQAKGDYALRSELPEVPDMNDYAKAEDVNDALNALAQHIPTDYLTESDLQGYAKTSDIPSVQGLASEDYVAQQIEATLGVINRQLEEV